MYVTEEVKKIVSKTERKGKPIEEKRVLSKLKKLLYPVVKKQENGTLDEHRKRYTEGDIVCTKEGNRFIITCRGKKTVAAYECETGVTRARDIFKLLDTLGINHGDVEILKVLEKAMKKRDKLRESKIVKATVYASDGYSPRKVELAYENAGREFAVIYDDPDGNEEIIRALVTIPPKETAVNMIEFYWNERKQRIEKTGWFEMTEEGEHNMVEYIECALREMEIINRLGKSTKKETRLCI